MTPPGLEAIGNRYDPRLLKQYIGMLLTSSPGLKTGDSTPHEVGFLLRRVAPSLVSIQVWSYQLSTGFSTFPLAQREVSQSARYLNVGFQFKSRVRGVQRANT
jgi:hypothetical protein